MIFIFYNEPISPLMRSIHSVLHRTPPELLKEIILIDDGSDAEWMGAELERHVRTLPKVGKRHAGQASYTRAQKC